MMESIYPKKDILNYMNTVKISKEKMKLLLDKISEDNFEYGLIFKLCYIYGRLISEVYDVHEDDIDFEKNKIRFNINGEDMDFPLHNAVYDDLKRQCDETRGFLFHHLYDDFDKFVRNMNYQLRRYDAYCGVHISPRDFKKLRGQHLLLDGLDVKCITDLYCNYDNSATKRLIRYNDMLHLNDDVSVSDILTDYTML